MTAYTIEDLQELEYESDVPWIHPRQVLDLELAFCRDLNYRVRVLKEDDPFEDSLEDWPDNVVVEYMSHYHSETSERGGACGFRAYDYIDATVYLITEAWSASAAFRLAHFDLVEFEGAWEAFELIREKYASLPDWPRFLLNYYTIDVFGGGTFAENSRYPNPEEKLTASQLRFLEEVRAEDFDF